MKKVCHVITGLSVGGAEMMLLKLLRHRKRNDLEHCVVSLLPHGPLASRIGSEQVEVFSLNMRRGIPWPLHFLRLRRLIKRLAPQLLQGWMYHGNLAAWWAYRAGGGSTRLYWNIRHSITCLEKEKWLTRRMIRLGARWSSCPECILYNSETAAAQHEHLGYDPSRRCVIPNGFDVERFKPDAAWRHDVRMRLGVPDDAMVIGMVARHHPMKDYPTFLCAAMRHLQDHPKTHFMLIGQGVDASSPDFAGCPDGRIHLLGEQHDPEKWMNAMDIFCLSSAWGDAFPNVLGEAMACGLPCVATDVGDARRLIGDTGRIVPVRDAAALAGAWTDLMAAGLKKQGDMARQRIERNYRIEQIVERYESLYVSGLCPGSGGEDGEPR